MLSAARFGQLIDLLNVLFVFLLLGTFFLLFDAYRESVARTESVRDEIAQTLNTTASEKEDSNSE